MPRKKDKRPDWFKIFRVIRPLVKAVPAESAGTGFIAALDYFETGEEPENLDPFSKAVFESLRGYVDQAWNDYEEIVRRNTENGKKNNVPTGYNSYPVEAEEEREREEERDSEEEYRSNDYARSYPADTSMQPPSKLFIKMPLKDGNTFGISETDVAAYAKRYPGVDVEQAFRSMTAWLLSNPTKQKTRQTMGKFITHWLDQAQDNGQHSFRIVQNDEDH